MPGAAPVSATLEALEHPIVQAPMGGGPGTAALAAAVSGAGGLGFLAAGYQATDAVRADVEAVRATTERPFGVNVFAPPGPAGEPAAIARYAAALAGEAARSDVELGEPRHHDDGWAAKLALLAELRVPSSRRRSAARRRRRSPSCRAPASRSGSRSRAPRRP
jgi:nitronate monooxygenase